jgi:nicotinamidase-related amidase
MPVTLDENVALIVVDLQKGVVGLPGAPHPIAPVVERAAELAEAFRGRALPVVLINTTGGAPGRAAQQWSRGQLPSDWAELVPELNRQPSDILATKKTWGAFTNTGLGERLKALGVTQVVVLGVATSIGAESTARQAHELGFNVAIVSDAVTDLSPEAHENSLTRILPRLSEIGTTQEILDLLQKRNS